MNPKGSGIVPTSLSLAKVQLSSNCTRVIGKNKLLAPPIVKCNRRGPVFSTDELGGFEAGSKLCGGAFISLWQQSCSASDRVVS